MRILVAEDDARLRQQLVAALRDVGHQVDHTGDGLDALRLLGIHPYDAGVLDITMPGNLAAFCWENGWQGKLYDLSVT